MCRGTVRVLLPLRQHAGGTSLPAVMLLQGYAHRERYVLDLGAGGWLDLKISPRTFVRCGAVVGHTAGVHPNLRRIQVCICSSYESLTSAFYAHASCVKMRRLRRLLDSGSNEVCQQ